MKTLRDEKLQELARQNARTSRKVVQQNPPGSGLNQEREISEEKIRIVSVRRLAIRTGGIE